MATLRKRDMTSRIAAKLEASQARGEAALNAVLDSAFEKCSPPEQSGAYRLRCVRDQAGESQKSEANSGRSRGELDPSPSPPTHRLHRVGRTE